MKKFSEDVWTVPEVACRFKVKESTVRKWILERRIDYIKFRRSVRIPKEAVEKMMAAGFRPAISEGEGRHG